MTLCRSQSFARGRFWARAVAFRAKTSGNEVKSKCVWEKRKRVGAWRKEGRKKVVSLLKYLLCKLVGREYDYYCSTTKIKLLFAPPFQPFDPLFFGAADLDARALWPVLLEALGLATFFFCLQPSFQVLRIEDQHWCKTPPLPCSRLCLSNNETAHRKSSEPFCRIWSQILLIQPPLTKMGRIFWHWQIEMPIPFVNAGYDIAR